MKKFTSIIAVLMMALLAACSSGGEETKSKDKEGQAVNVDKGLFNVEVTLPASFFDEKDIDKDIAEAKKEGIKEVTKNADGSLTYKMSRSKHKELMKDLKKTTVETVEELKQDENFVSIKDITYNDTFSEFTLVVEKAAYENSMDGFASIGLGMSGAMYQLFSGANQDDYQVKVMVKDEATSKVFDEMVYPDDLEEEETE
jgi:hypothetical protein